MKKIIIFFLLQYLLWYWILAACSKADVKPVAVVSTVDNIGIDTTIITIDKPRKKGHEWGPK